MGRSTALLSLFLLLPACDDPPQPQPNKVVLAHDETEGETGDAHAADDSGELASKTKKHLRGEAEEEAREDENNPPPTEVGEARQALVGELRSRGSKLENERIALEKRDAELSRLRGELDSRLQSITELEQRLQAELGIGKVAKERREERVSALADLISTMRPQAGADLLAQMSDTDAQSLLLAISLKSERKAAKVLSLMPPERAAQLGQLYLDVEAPPPGSERLGPTGPSNPAIPSAPAPARAPDDSAPGPRTEAQGPSESILDENALKQSS